jgi:hypothetical protein
MSFPHALSGNPGSGLYSGSPIETIGDDNLKRNAAKALTATYETASHELMTNEVPMTQALIGILEIGHSFGIRV